MTINVSVSVGTAPAKSVSVPDGSTIGDLVDKLGCSECNDFQEKNTVTNLFDPVVRTATLQAGRHYLLQKRRPVTPLMPTGARICTEQHP